MTNVNEQDIELKRFFKEMPKVASATSVKVKRLHPDAVIPSKAHATDAGFDLVSVKDVIIEPGETVVVKTGIAVDLPAGYVMDVRPRSGITVKTKLRVQYGTVDSGYNGEVGVIIDNIQPPIYEKLGELALTDVVVSIDGYNDDKTFAITHCFPSGTHFIPKGTRLAQAVITRLPSIEFVEVAELGKSGRGGNGFGSTGV